MATENPPAFPLQVSHGDEMGEPSYGMSLRDYFAGQALAGALSEIRSLNCKVGSEWVAEVNAAATVAFAIADAMLAERAKIKIGDQRNPISTPDPTRLWPSSPSVMRASDRP